MKIHLVARAGGVFATAGVLGLTALATANAHVNAYTYGKTPVANGTSSTTLFFRVPHSCGDGYETNKVVINLSSINSVGEAKPQEVGGWVTTSDSTSSTDAAGVTTITTTAVRWADGWLPGNQFQDFGLNVKLPKAATGAKIYFPTTQFCNAEVSVKKAPGSKKGKKATSKISGQWDDVAGHELTFVAVATDSTETTLGTAKASKDGSVSLVVKTSKIPAGANVQIRHDEEVLGNSVAATESWTDISGASGVANPAPSVTVGTAN